MPDRAKRLEAVRPFHVMAIVSRAKALEAAGRSIVHMEIGEPDFGPPEPVREAALAAVAAGRGFYTQAAGMPELRQAIATDYRARYGIAVDPERILVTPGASGALQLALAAVTDPGDRVLLPDPDYPCNRNLALTLGAEPVAICGDPVGGFALDPDRVTASWTARTRALLLGSPANPTGHVFSREALGALVETVTDLGGTLIMDEIYHGLVYDGRATSVLELTDNALVVNSFSKYFGMTGWRIGWLVVPDGWVDPVERLAQNLFIAAPTPAQHAALAAFEPAAMAELESRRSAFEARRDYLVTALGALGFEIAGKPSGAFYVYARCDGLTDSSERLARDLLEEAGVAITPGLDFGTHEADAFVRFAYTTGLPSLREGVRRIAGFLGRPEPDV